MGTARLYSGTHQFVVDEVSNVIKEAIETTIGGNSYTHAKVNQWTKIFFTQIPNIFHPR